MEALWSGEAWLPRRKPRRRRRRAQPAMCLRVRPAARPGRRWGSARGGRGGGGGRAWALAGEAAEKVVATTATDDDDFGGPIAGVAAQLFKCDRVGSAGAGAGEWSPGR